MRSKTETVKRQLKNAYIAGQRSKIDDGIRLSKGSLKST